MHYPYNYILLSRWYHGLESFIYVFINCFFYAAAVATIALIDKNKEIHWKQIFQRIRSSYIHLAAAMLLNVFSLSLLSFLFAIVIRRAEQIRSTAGTYSVIKSIILISAPYMHFLMAILSFSAFAFLIPIIILENKSFFAALKSNFLRYGGLIADVFILSGLTGSLYLPFLLYRSFLSEKWAVISPEISGLWLVLSILVMLIIDAVQWTAITLLYLSKTEVRP